MKLELMSAEADYETRRRLILDNGDGAVDTLRAARTAELLADWDQKLIDVRRRIQRVKQSDAYPLRYRATSTATRGFLLSNVKVFWEKLRVLILIHMPLAIKPFDRSDRG